MAAHPNVKINITVLENEAFKTKLATSMQAGDVPDLFQSWGGATMAQQADAGLLKDITADVSSWASTVNPGAMSIYQYNGKQYGIPWDMGMIGFWYNKKLFEQAGITAPPATWDELPRRGRQAQGRGHHPAGDRGQGRVAVDAPVDVPRPPQRRRRRPRPDGADRRLEHRRLRQGRPGRRRAERAQSLPGRLQGRDLQQRGGRGRQRQGGHGADGPVGAVGPEGPERRQEGPRRRPRLVRLPGRSPAARARPPTASAAATASRSARTRRPRPSTS